VKGKCQKRQDPDDDFGTSNCAHEGPLKGILDRNKPLESKGNRKPDAEAGKDGASVDQGLTEALPIEQVDPKVV